jgi:anti-sigma regulatory factor (Ser/Thr protein kinase)
VEVAATAVHVVHRSDAGEARRRAAELAAGLGLDEAAVGRVALVATELVTNVLKHARGGWFYVSPAPGSAAAVDVLVTDRGGGISDLQQALGDGYSTAGTPGTGIGAVRRQSVEFDVFTQSDGGTVAAARVGPDPARNSAAPEPGVQVRGYAAPIPGEAVCGDTWAARQINGATGVLVADGLGHGPDASTASVAAARVFLASRATSPAAMVEEIHQALGATRGAAVAVAWIAPSRDMVRFAGIGNISASILSEGNGKGMVSSNGTAGYVARTVRDYEYAAPSDALVVLHSDGLSSRWDVGDYPGLSLRSPAIVAGVLLRDFTRGRDDASIVVARMPPAPGAP